jgi:hypothetical protein
MHNRRLEAQFPAFESSGWPSSRLYSEAHTFPADDSALLPSAPSAGVLHQAKKHCSRTGIARWLAAGRQMHRFPASPGAPAEANCRSLTLLPSCSPPLCPRSGAGKSRSIRGRVLIVFACIYPLDAVQSFRIARGCDLPREHAGYYHAL